MKVKPIMIKRLTAANSSEYTADNKGLENFPMNCGRAWCLLEFQETLHGNLPHLIISHTWVFPKIGVPQNGWFIMENPIKMDDLGVPLCWKHPHIHT